MSRAHRRDVRTEEARAATAAESSRARRADPRDDVVVFFQRAALEEARALRPAMPHGAARWSRRLDPAAAPLLGRSASGTAGDRAEGSRRRRSARPRDDRLHRQRAGADARARRLGVGGIFTDCPDRALGRLWLVGEAEQPRALRRELAATCTPTGSARRPRRRHVGRQPAPAAGFTFSRVTAPRNVCETTSPVTAFADGAVRRRLELDRSGRTSTSTRSPSAGRGRVDAQPLPAYSTSPSPRPSPPAGSSCR